MLQEILGYFILEVDQFFWQRPSYKSDVSKENLSVAVIALHALLSIYL